MEPVQTPRVFSNRYELTHLIARGGMAQVYRARDRLLDRPVAVKVLFPELSVDRAFVERFRREAQAAANLSHPNIVPVFDWGEDGGTYFIVMEYIDGEPLSATLRSSGPMAPERVADIGAHVAAALAYAHRHGVIHRDVKPGNVLMTEDGQVKVTDFGIARAVNTEESLTQTGAVMGTATYFSPEQAEGIGVDSRSDIYSLGVVLFEMLAGRPPFQGESPVAVASKHVRDQPPILSELAPGVPVALEAVVAKAMAKSPDARYANADDLRADLLRFAAGRPVVAGDPATTRLQQAVGATTVMGAVDATQAVPVGGMLVTDAGLVAADRSRTGWLVAALVLLLVALAVIAYFLVKDIGDSSFAMPNVVGQPAATARADLVHEGLVVGPTTAKYSSTAKGTVLSTTPAATRKVKKGQRVVLTVSAGPKPVTMVKVPTVVNSSLAAAEAVLSDTHLGSKPTFVVSSKPATTVLAQTPKPSASVPIHTKVKLTVAKAGSTVPVPHVAGETETLAKASLAASTLTTGAVTSACSSSFGRGLVASTSPATGIPEPKGTAVALTVSSGPCSAPVPNVVGSTLAGAKATLTKQGFSHVATTTVSSCSPSENGKVVSETPAAGTTTPTSGTVDLGVCNATVPTPSPTKTSTPSKRSTPAPTTASKLSGGLTSPAG